MDKQAFIPVNTPDIGELEQRYVMQCLRDGWVSSEGPWIPRFEEACARRFGRRHAIAVCNGSAALDAAVAALSLTAGDEVIMPTFTIISCAAAVIRAGGVPVFVDSDPATWCMDVNQVESKIGPRTKAIMAVHIYGLPVDMDPLLALAEKHGLYLIEDAAESHGQQYKGRPCGSFGSLSTLSFYANKHVTTGEGGMILTDDDRLAARCRSLRNLCFQPERRFVHEELGWNLRMTSLQAALGLAQIERLDEFVERKRAMGQQYTELLAHLRTAVALPALTAHGSPNHYWVFGVVLSDDVPCDAAAMMRRLAAAGIGSRPFFWPMHEQPLLREMGLTGGDLYPVSERIARRGFYLPSGLALSADSVARSAAVLAEELDAID
jgi:perosamine synthetase